MLEYFVQVSRYGPGVPAGIRKVRKCVPSNFQSVYAVRNHNITSRPGPQLKHVLTARLQFAAN